MTQVAAEDVSAGSHGEAGWGQIAPGGPEVPGGQERRRLQVVRLREDGAGGERCPEVPETSALGGTRRTSLHMTSASADIQPLPDVAHDDEAAKLERKLRLRGKQPVAQTATVHLCMHGEDVNDCRGRRKELTGKPSQKAGEELTDYGHEGCKRPRLGQQVENLLAIRAAQERAWLRRLEQFRQRRRQRSEQAAADAREQHKRARIGEEGAGGGVKRNSNRVIFDDSGPADPKRPKLELRGVQEVRQVHSGLSGGNDDSVEVINSGSQPNVKDYCVMHECKIFLHS